MPLNGDFTEESWTVEGFKRNILKQREGKRPLLTGDITVTLKEGVGVIAGDVAFTDNSSWTRSRKFRLGARLTGAVEARSEAFGCKDQRGECKYPLLRLVSVAVTAFGGELLIFCLFWLCSL